MHTDIAKSKINPDTDALPYFVFIYSSVLIRVHRGSLVLMPFTTEQTTRTTDEH